MNRRIPVRLPAMVLAALTSAALVADAAAAATLHVDIGHPACSDIGAGTPAQPFCHIAAAASRAAPGDTVQVASGTYPERISVPSGTAAAPVTLTAAPGATVNVTGQANGFSLSARSYVTIRGFTISNTSSNGIVAWDASHIVLSDNTVHHAGRPVQGSTASGIQLSNVADSVITQNVVHDNTSYGINVVNGSTHNTIDRNRVFANAMQWQRAASGIRFFGSPENTVSRNMTFGNEDTGIEFVTGSNDNLAVANVSYGNGDHGIDTYRSPGVRIIGNTVYDNPRAAGIDVEGDSPGATIRNNIAVRNGITVGAVAPRTKGNIRVDASSRPGTMLDSDIVWQASPSDRNFVWGSLSYETLADFRVVAPEQEVHGIQADPKWQDPASHDFRLTAGSPAIDSADSTVAGQLADDIEGTPRSDDPATPNTGIGPPRPYDDRGAYEFPGGPPPGGPGAPADGAASSDRPASSGAATGADGPRRTAAGGCARGPTTRIAVVRRRSATRLEVRGSARPAARGCAKVRRVTVRLIRRDGRSVVTSRARGTARWVATVRLPRRVAIRSLRVQSVALDAAGRRGRDRIRRHVPRRVTPSPVVKTRTRR